MKLSSLGTLAASFAPGERIFLPGSAGEAAAFTAALVADPTLTRGVEIVTSFIPGVNPLPVEAMAPDARVLALFMQPGGEAARADGRLRHLPVSYGGFVRDLARHWKFDATVVHVSPPDAQGRCSLGLATEFTLLAAARSRRRLAVVNPRMPAIPGAPWMLLEAFDDVAEDDSPPRTYDPGPPDAAALAIAGHVAAFVPDGATLQLGIGKAPAALALALAGHRHLRFWSGMISDGFLDLADAGALAEGADHVCCAALGSAAFYARLAARTDVRVTGCDITHDATRLAAASPLHAVNGALEVDLWGQCNLERIGGRMVSGPGGAPDFARAAAREGGSSIVALPSTAGRRARSRIVARLDGGIVTLARHEVDLVVTEHGAADLRGKSSERRAQALIAVAEPAQRERLARAWRDGPSPTEGAAA